MHICMATTGLNALLPEEERYGAIEPYAYELSKQLSNNHNVTLLGRGYGNQTRDNLTIDTINYRSPRSELDVLYDGALFNRFLIKRLMALHRTAPVDVLHIHTVYSGITTTFSKLFLKVPSVCSIHNTIKTLVPLRYCDKLLANSEYIKNVLLARKDVDPQKVDVLPIAVDINKFKSFEDAEATKQRLGLCGKKIILFVGRKIEYKGPQVIIDALPSIVKEEKAALAVFIGPDFSFASSSVTFSKTLEQRAVHQQVKANTLFKTKVSEKVLLDYYNAADVCVCPSLWQEPFGKVVLEAQAFEKPVVVSNVGGLPEIVRNYKSGIIVPPADHQRLTEALLFLLKNPKISRQFGKQGRQLLEVSYSFQAVARRCSKIYAEIS